MSLAGSSLKVRPVSLIPMAVSPDVPQILINREPLPHYTADIELLGNCDDVLREIALRMGEEAFVEETVKEDVKTPKKIVERRDFDQVSDTFQPFHPEICSL